jgi:BlaI family transcriptional regulator, penicillinase repressor
LRGFSPDQKERFAEREKTRISACIRVIRGLLSRHSSKRYRVMFFEFATHPKSAVDASTGQPVRWLPLITAFCNSLDCSMADSAPTDRELQALKVLWQRGGTTVREVWNMLSADDRNLAYTTVLSLMQVMEQKQLVEHRAEGKTYIYFPRVQRQSVFRQLARGFLDRVFDGAVDEYLVHALESRRPNDEELARLEKMIAVARKQISSDGDQDDDGRTDSRGGRVSSRLTPASERPPHRRKRKK